MISGFHSRNFALLVLFSFLAIGVFCLWGTTTMSMSESSGNCAVYGGEIALCGTDTQSHNSAWQNFLNVIPQKTFELLLLALLLIFVSATYKNIWPRAPEIVKSLVARAYATLDIIDPIKRALARGIIQPKIYPSYIG